MNNNKKLLLKLENAGYTVNDKSLVKGVSFEVKQDRSFFAKGISGQNSKRKFKRSHG